MIVNDDTQTISSVEGSTKGNSCVVSDLNNSAVKYDELMFILI